MKLIFIVLLVHAVSYSQSKIRVLDATSLEPVRYANILFINNGKTFLTDSLGSFSLDNKINIKISCLGYEDMTIENADSDTIYMRPKVNLLNEVKLSKRKTNKPIELGFHKTRKKNLNIPFSKNINRYYGAHIRNDDNKNYFIKELIVRLKSNAVQSVVRLHLYEFDDKSGKIIKEIMNENVILRIDGKSNIRKVDIQNLNITFPQGGVVLAIEPIENTESINIGIGALEMGNLVNYMVFDENLVDSHQLGQKGSEVNWCFMFGISVIE